MEDANNGLQEAFEDVGLEVWARDTKLKLIERS